MGKEGVRGEGSASRNSQTHMQDIPRQQQALAPRSPATTLSRLQAPSSLAQHTDFPSWERRDGSSQRGYMGVMKPAAAA